MPACNFFLFYIMSYFKNLHWKVAPFFFNPTPTPTSALWCLKRLRLWEGWWGWAPSCTLQETRRLLARYFKLISTSYRLNTRFFARLPPKQSRGLLIYQHIETNIQPTWPNRLSRERIHYMAKNHHFREIQSGWPSTYKNFEIVMFSELKKICSLPNN